MTKTNIVTLVAGSIFLPYILTAIILIGLAIYVIVNPDTRKMIFVHKGSKVLLAFFAYTFLVSCIYQNWLGLLVGFCIFLAFVLGLFIRSVMTKKFFEKILSRICMLSIMGTSCALTEKFIIPLFVKHYGINRATAMFFYPNYFGTIISTVIIICAYKVITRQGKMWFYYVVAFMNVISLYLSESMFAWVEVFLGVAALLLLMKKHRLLAIWLLMATMAIFFIFYLNINIIPRLSEAEVTMEVRVKIWRFAIQKIKEKPLFGHGFMSYIYDDKESFLGFLVPHSHSIYLESLLNFGVVGTGLFMVYFVKYYIAVIKSCFMDKMTRINSLILAVTAAALVHGIVDLTLMWVQTLPLFLIILAGFGAFEKDVVTKQT